VDEGYGLGLGGIRIPVTVHGSGGKTERSGVQVRRDARSETRIHGRLVKCRRNTGLHPFVSVWPRADGMHRMAATGTGFPVEHVAWRGRFQVKTTRQDAGLSDAAISPSGRFKVLCDRVLDAVAHVGAGRKSKPKTTAKTSAPRITD
jgi:hypothetical protein